MTCVAALILKLIKGTVLAVKKGQIRLLDANPGDKGCQLRAVILRQLAQSGPVLDELQQLFAMAERIEAILQIRRSITKPQTELACQFFQKHILPLEASFDVFYLIYCKLLTITKVKARVEPNGIVVTKLSHGDLSKLSPDIHLVEGRGTNFREQIVCDASSKLSQDSLMCMQEMAKKMRVSPLLFQMLMGVRQNKPAGNYKPKSFGCQFYEIQMVLTHLREQEALIAIKTVVVQGNPQLLFLKPAGPGKEFCFVDGKNIPPETLIVVFEGVVQPGLKLDEFAKKIERIGFSDLILACAAQEEPYEHGSTLNDVADPVARAEIESFIKRAPEIECDRDKNPLILLDHIFCNTLQEEIKGGAKPC
jgi:hypothetical protein